MSGVIVFTIEIIIALALGYLLWIEKQKTKSLTAVYSVKTVVVSNRDRDMSNVIRYMITLHWEWVAIIGAHYDKRVQMVFKRQIQATRLLTAGVTGSTLT